jgi:hypothetical protein
MEEDQVMDRLCKVCLFMLLGCICLATAHAADPAAKPSKAKPTASEAPQGTPVIQIPEATFDFGEVPEGGQVVHDYRIKNTGKAELLIERVQPG